MADILFVTMETGGLADKSSIYFLLSKTHSILLAEKLQDLHQKKNYPIYLLFVALNNTICMHTGVCACGVGTPTTGCNHILIT